MNVSLSFYWRGPHICNQDEVKRLDIQWDDQQDVTYTVAIPQWVYPNKISRVSEGDTCTEFKVSLEGLKQIKLITHFVDKKNRTSTKKRVVISHLTNFTIKEPRYCFLVSLSQNFAQATLYSSQQLEKFLAQAKELKPETLDKWDKGFDALIHVFFYITKLQDKFLNDLNKYFVILEGISHIHKQRIVNHEIQQLIRSLDMRNVELLTEISQRGSTAEETFLYLFRYLEKKDALLLLENSLRKTLKDIHIKEHPEAPLGLSPLHEVLENYLMQTVNKAYQEIQDSLK